jgi:hypothetical protein
LLTSSFSLRCVGFNFFGVASGLAETSASLCNAGGVAATAAAGWDLVFAGSGDASQQKFTLTTDQLQSATSLRFIHKNNE